MLIDLTGPLFLDFVGQCVVDDPSRLLDDHTVFSETLTPDLCIKHCLGKKFNYAGVQHYRNCFCGNTAPPDTKIVAHTDCNTRCTGDVNQMCGGSWRMNVFSTRLCPDNWQEVNQNCYQHVDCPDGWIMYEGKC